MVTYVLVNGRIVTIKFTERTQSDSYGFYFTTSEAVAKAIKKHPDYGKSFEEVPSIAKPKVEKVVKPDAVYEEVKTTQQAQKILVDKYGIDGSLINSKTDAKRYAKELNISFPNL